MIPILSVVGRDIYSEIRAWHRSLNGDQLCQALLFYGNRPCWETYHTERWVWMIGAGSNIQSTINAMGSVYTMATKKQLTAPQKPGSFAFVNITLSDDDLSELDRLISKGELTLETAMLSLCGHGKVSMAFANGSWVVTLLHQEGETTRGMSAFSGDVIDAWLCLAYKVHLNPNWFGADIEKKARRG